VGLSDSSSSLRKHTNPRGPRRIGTAALLTYSLSKSLVRSPEHSALLPHLALMRKANRFGRAHKLAQPPQAPAPAPAPKTQV
jgi:hypothetical protein